MTAVRSLGKTISAVSTTNPAIVTSVGHGLTTNDKVIMWGVMIDGENNVAPYNGIEFRVTVIDADNFSLNNLDGSQPPYYKSGGVLYTPVDISPALLTTLTSVKNYLVLLGKPITAITKGAVTTLTIPSHELVQNTLVGITRCVGLTDINDKLYPITVVDADNVTIAVDSSTMPDYTGGGFASPDDVVLYDLIRNESAWFLNQIGVKNFYAQEYIELRNGDGTRGFTPLNMPLLDVYEVYVNNVSIPLRPGPSLPGWMVQNNRIYLDDYAGGNPFPGDYGPYYVDGARWRYTKGRGNVLFHYRAGFETLPADVDGAVTQLVAWRYRERDRIGIRSRSVGGGQSSEVVTYMVDSCPASVKEVIENMRGPHLWL